MEVVLSLGNIVLDGDPAPPPLMGHTPNFWPMSIVAKPLDGMPLGMKVDLGPGDFVFYGAQLPSEKKGTAPIQFLAHVYCGQTAGWIKMPLGTEVNLGPGDVVLDGVEAPLKGAQSPVFGPCLLWPNGWMDEDASWYESTQATLC